MNELKTEVLEALEVIKKESQTRPLNESDLTILLIASLLEEEK